MNLSQYARVLKAAKHLRDAVTDLRAVSDELPPRGPETAWKCDLAHWAHEVGEILSTDHGEAGLEPCLPKMKPVDHSDQIAKMKGLEEHRSNLVAQLNDAEGAAWDHIYWKLKTCQDRIDNLRRDMR